MTLPKINYVDLNREDAVANGVVLWGEKHDERIIYDDLDEAIENYLDGWWKFDEDVREPGTTLEFAGFKRMEPPSPDLDADWVLEWLLERWDEELADPEGESTKPTGTMKAAALDFVKAVRAEYQSWACESVVEVVVPVRAWVEQHCPDWLEETS